MASAKPNKTISGGKLGQTLTDLEAALNDWDSLTDAPVTPAAPAAEVASATDRGQDPGAELRKKTKKLLDQLREQLAELAE